MNYLQQERNYNILNGISRILQQNHLLGAESLSLLADKTINKTSWTSVIMDRFDARAIPVYNSEFITRINTAYQQETSQINSTMSGKLLLQITYQQQKLADYIFNIKPWQEVMKQNLLLTGSYMHSSQMS